MTAKRIDVAEGGPDKVTKKASVQPAAELYGLTVKAFRSLSDVTRNQLKPFKLTVMQWLVLSVINNGNARGVATSSIGKKVGVGSAQVTSLTSQLIDKRLIRSRTERRDRRQKRFQLTARGRTVLNGADAAVQTALGQWLQPVPDNYLVFYQRVLTIMTR